jgi:hypothetical protein
MPPRHYLNDGYGVTSWLFTRDQRIGLCIRRDHRLFFIGGAMAVLDPARVATPTVTSSRRNHNKLSHLTA